MPSTTYLIKKLKKDFPQFKFEESSSFSWSHSDNTIYYIDDSDDFKSLLHELSHGLLGHTDYSRDIELIAMERSAWDKATELAKKYDLLIDDDFIQSSLDTYRDWMHSRSTCPKCHATGLQVQKSTYECLSCSHKWQVNEARTCSLRRYNK